MAPSPVARVRRILEQLFRDAEGAVPIKASEPNETEAFEVAGRLEPASRRFRRQSAGLQRAEGSRGIFGSSLSLSVRLADPTDR
jgi:hypothetical protein